MDSVEYSNASDSDRSQPEPRDRVQAMLRGLRKKCPRCGKGSLFSGFLKVGDSCNHCGEELHHQKSDDAAPYFTILIIGHITVPLLLIVERSFHPPVWVYAATLIPLVISLALLILPRIKGAIIGLQWALRMHGFDEDGETLAEPHI